MPETTTKAELLTNIRAGYHRLEALLAPWSEQQLTTPQGTSTWSIKDHIAHLTGWQGYLLDQLQAVLTNTRPTVFMPGLSTVDEVNERFYREYKDRPWASILEGFRVSYQRVLATVEGMSEESLYAPFLWRQDVASLWSLIAEDTYEHYQEHGEIMRHSLPH
jgi:hypothetical protein